MYIFPMLWLRAGLFILIWMASLASLETCLLPWSIILEVGDVGLGVVAGKVMFVNSTDDMTSVFFYFYFPNICSILLC